MPIEGRPARAAVFQSTRRAACDRSDGASARTRTTARPTRGWTGRARGRARARMTAQSAWGRARVSTGVWYGFRLGDRRRWAACGRSIAGRARRIKRAAGNRCGRSFFCRCEGDAGVRIFSPRRPVTDRRHCDTPAQGLIGLIGYLY